MKLVIGCDEAAYSLKEVIRSHLGDSGHDVTDFGVLSADETVLYPDVAMRVARAVADGQFERGILLCGTGIGVCITANKVPGIRAALCHDVYSAERAAKSNDAQIITMGGRVIGPEHAKSIVDAYLASTFDSGRSGPKVARISEYEAELKS